MAQATRNEEKGMLKKSIVKQVVAVPVRQQLVKRSAGGTSRSRCPMPTCSLPEEPRSHGVTDKVHTLVGKALLEMQGKAPPAASASSAPAKVGAPRKMLKTINGCSQCFKRYWNINGGHNHECGLSATERVIFMKDLRRRASSA
jgi:hypothetical protein